MCNVRLAGRRYFQSISPQGPAIAALHIIKKMIILPQQTVVLHPYHRINIKHKYVPI